MTECEAVAELADIVRMLCAMAAQQGNAPLARLMQERCDGVIDEMRTRFPS